MSLNLKPFIKETTNGNDIAGFATFYIVFLFFIDYHCELIEMHLAHQ